MMIETARREENLSISKACSILGLGRTEYYRKVYGLRDYQKKEKVSRGIEPLERQMIEELSLENPEYGHKKIWALVRYRYNGEITKYETYRAMKEMGLLLPGNYTQLDHNITGRPEDSCSWIYLCTCLSSGDGSL